MAKRPPKVTPEPDPAAREKAFVKALLTATETADAFESRAADDLGINFSAYQRARERLHLAADDLIPILKKWGA